MVSPGAILTLRRPTNIVAITGIISSCCFYVAYRNHDRRELSEEEVAIQCNQLRALAQPQVAVVPSPPSPPPPSSNAHTKERMVDQHLSNLQRYGVTVVKNVLSSDQLAEWNAHSKEAFTVNNGRDIVWNSGRAHIIQSKRSSKHYHAMSRIGQSCCCDDDTKGDDAIDDEYANNGPYNWLGIFRRKIHNNKNGDSSAKMVNESNTTASLQDVIKSYFRRHGIHRYTLSDLQFLNAMPQSTHQIWHRDNKFVGLTALVALRDVRGNGPTEVLLGSHECDTFSMVWHNYWDVVRKKYLPAYFCKEEEGCVRCENERSAIINESIPLLGCIDAGDALLYDARIFHRGRGYNTMSTTKEATSTSEGGDGGGDGIVEMIVDRPVIALSMSSPLTPPPGTGLIVTTANIYIGSMVRASLFALQNMEKAFGSSNSDR